MISTMRLPGLVPSPDAVLKPVVSSTMRLPGLVPSPDAVLKPVGPGDQSIADEVYKQLLLMIEKVWRISRQLPSRRDPSQLLLVLVILASLTVLAAVAWMFRGRVWSVVLRRRGSGVAGRRVLPTAPVLTPPPRPARQQRDVATGASPAHGYVTPVGRRLFRTPPSATQDGYEDMTRIQPDPARREPAGIVLCQQLQDLLVTDVRRVLRLDWQWIRFLNRVHTPQVPLLEVLEEEDSAGEDGRLGEGEESLSQEDGRQGEVLVQEGQGGLLAAVEMVAGGVEVHQQEDGGETVEQGVIRPEQSSYPPLRRWPRIPDSQLSLLMRDEVKECGADEEDAESLQVPAEDVIQGPGSGQGEPRRGRGRGGRRGEQRRRGRARGSSPGVSGGTRSGRRYRRT